MTQTDFVTLKAIRKQYHNPDPIVQLVGKVNEAHIFMDDVEGIALVDLGEQISTTTIEFIKQLRLKISLLGRIEKLETCGRDFPYMGYVEVNLKIPEIKAFNEDVLMLVIENSEYAQ